MYNYNFSENKETIIKEEKNINIKIDKNYYVVNFVLTDKSLLIFSDENENNPLKSRLVYSIPQYNLVLKISINDLKYSLEEDCFIININDNKIICYGIDLDEFIG